MKQADQEIIALLREILDAGGGGGAGGSGISILSAGNRGGITVAAASTGFWTFCYTGAANVLNGTSSSATELERQMIIPVAGTLKRFFVHTSAAQPADGAFTLTVRINGVDTGIVIVIPADAAAGVFSEVATEAEVVAGDLISFSAVNASPGTASAAVNHWAITVE